MKKITQVSYMTILALLMTLFSCTKEIPEPAVTVDDLVGEWNGYGYVDYDGLVPLEVIRIEKHGKDSLVAIKIVGDNAILSGVMTWTGRYTSNPFKVNYFMTNGVQYTYQPAMMKVEGPNLLTSQFGRFVRRTEKYNP